jgi:hypothetical protein
VTPEEIERLPAGRQLNAEVARAVFGAQFADWVADREHRNWVFMADAPLQGVINGEIVDIPNYSTEIAPAWDVLRWIVETAGTIEILWDMEDHGREPGDIISLIVPGYSADIGPAALVICHAALFVALRQQEAAS